MDIHKIKDLPADELKTLLEGESASIEQIGYKRPLTPTELSEYQNKYATLSISRSNVEDEKKAVNADFKTQLDMLKKQSKECLQIIKEKAEPVFGDCYKIIDYEAGRVYLIDDTGYVAVAREIRAEERQLRIVNA